MHITSLSLRSFRNYFALELKLDPYLNIFVGDNAQGKTNLLEACYLLATTRSHRTHRDEEMIRWSDDGYHLKAVVNKRGGPTQLELHYGPQSGKITKVHGVIQNRTTDFIGHLNVVLFAPEHLELVKGEPALRRRFLDMSIGQVNRSYLYHLSQYSKVLQQKNSLLKNSDVVNRDLLATYNQQLIDLGSRITLKREQITQQLDPLANQSHRSLSGEEQLSITYQANIGAGVDLQGLARNYEQLLKQKMDEEIRRRQSLVGPHRDDLSFTVNGVNLRHFGSQGQQRSAVLSLKMAEVAMMQHETGESPVLLLDDVLSELDPHRQEHLLQLVTGFTQTLISTTDHPPIFARKGRSFRVKAGSVKELQ